MKHIILATAFLTLSTPFLTAQAATERSFAEQLNMQLQQLQPQEFNFFSDRYKQLKAHEHVSNNQLVMANEQNHSFKEQLDGQTQQLKGHEFHPASDAYYQIISR